MVVGSCVSLQVGAALAARLFPQIGSGGAVFLRLGIAALILLALVRPRIGRWDAEQWRAVAVLGVCFAGMNGFFYASIARLPLGTAVTIEFLGPLVLAAVLSRRARDLIWVGLAGAGVALLGLNGSGGAGLDPVGVVLVLIAATFWALYILASVRVGARVPGHGGLAVATGIGALVLMPTGAAGAVQAFSSLEVALLGVGMAVLASVIPYTLELAALRRLPTSVFGILLSLEPAAAALAGWVLLSQHLGVAELVAIPLVMLASVGSTLTSRRADIPVAAEDGEKIPADVELVHA